MFERTALKTVYGNQFTSSTHLIKPNYPVIPLIVASPQFL